MPRDGNLPASRVISRRFKDTDPDDHLVALIRRDQKLAWSLLVERHLTPVTRYAYWILRDRSAAEDVAQETFIRLIKKSSNWEPGGAPLRAWLFRVARNLCIDRKRSSHRNGGEAIDTVAETSVRSDLETDMDIQTTVQRALNRLPERQRSAIILVHFEGLTGAEASLALGSSIEAVESLLSRARRALRSDLSTLIPDLLEN
ncbi:MAG: sigma-70 family RNA polymerase sigma factor [Rhodospirillaceae bacterium]